MCIQRFFSSLFSKTFCGRLIICFSLVCVEFFDSAGQESLTQSSNSNLLYDFGDVEFNAKMYNAYEFFQILDSIDAISSPIEKISFRVKLCYSKKILNTNSLKLCDSLFRETLDFVEQDQVELKIKVYTYLSQFKFNLKDYISALDLNWKILSLDDRNVHALKYNAKIYTKVRDYQLAIKVLDHLLSFDNLNPKLRAELLTVQADIILRSAPLKAIPLIKESYPILFSKRAGDMFRIKQLDRLSLCYLKLGDSIRAKSYLKKAIMFDHNEVSQVALPGVLLRLSRIMINEFQLDSARILAERAFIIHNEIQDRNRISSLRVLYDIYKMQHDSLALDKIKDVYMQELASENKRILQADLMVEQYNKQRESINSNSLNIIQSSISIYQKLALFILVILVLVQIIWWKRKTLFCYWHQLYPINGQSETSVTFKSKNTSQQPQTFSRDTLEHQVGFTINATDWKVIELLMAQPLLTVEELAAAVFLSKDGMKTSLRRLYKTFNIKEGGSKKVRLIQCLKHLKEQIEEK